MPLESIPSSYKHDPNWVMFQEMVATGQIRAIILSMKKKLVADIDDLEQDVVLHMMRKDIPRKFDPSKKKSFRNFMYMVVQHTTITLWRKYRRQQVVEDPEGTLQTRECFAGDSMDIFALLQEKDGRSDTPQETVERQALFHAFRAELAETEFPEAYRRVATKVAETPLGKLPFTPQTVWRLWEAGLKVNQIGKFYGASHYKVLELLEQVYTIYKKYL